MKNYWPCFHINITQFCAFDFSMFTHMQDWQEIENISLTSNNWYNNAMITLSKCLSWIQSEILSFYATYSHKDLFWLGRIMKILNSHDIEYKSHHWVWKRKVIDYKHYNVVSADTVLRLIPLIFFLQLCWILTILFLLPDHENLRLVKKGKISTFATKIK